MTVGSTVSFFSSFHKDMKGIKDGKDAREHTLVLVANAGSAFAYSIAIALLDCFVDTAGPLKVTRELEHLSIYGVKAHLDIGLKLVGEFLEPLHFGGRKGIHIEEKVAAWMIKGV